MKRLFLLTAITILTSCSALKPAVHEDFLPKKKEAKSFDDSSDSARSLASIEEEDDSSEPEVVSSNDDDIEEEFSEEEAEFLVNDEQNEDKNIEQLTKIKIKEAEDRQAMSLLEDKEKNELKKISKKKYLSDEENFDLEKESAYLKNNLDELDPQTIRSLEDYDIDELKAQQIKAELEKERLAILDDTVKFEKYVKVENAKNTEGRFNVLKTNDPTMMANLEKSIKPKVSKDIIKRSIASEEKKERNLASINYGPKNLFYAARKGFPGTIRYFIHHKKLDVNSVDEKNGKTALIHAVENGKFGNVRALLNFRADKSIRDQKGKTALDYAKELGHPHIERLLQ